ncbi:hypothetical protein E2C01_072784 [Portunus trituberculatus]|uniref:Uncharacterized protein n=1 Tax=Portunus trituberculatus TaxID=210409 RepID=A0A5B7I0Z6_PORTR|nr:hypothetical protein [Portunus trituberculatus]
MSCAPRKQILLPVAPSRFSPATSQTPTRPATVSHSLTASLVFLRPLHYRLPLPSTHLSLPTKTLKSSFTSSAHFSLPSGPIPSSSLPILTCVPYLHPFSYSFSITSYRPL